eukprot:scaffold856_cov326-Pavlova_lutheri.AAC.6
MFANIVGLCKVFVAHDVGVVLAELTVRSSASEVLTHVEELELVGRIRALLLLLLLHFGLLGLRDRF